MLPILLRNEWFASFKFQMTLRVLSLIWSSFCMQIDVIEVYLSWLTS